MSHHHYEDVIDPNEIDQEIERLEKQKEAIVEKEKIKNQKAWDLSQKLIELKKIRAENEKDITKTILELNKLCTHEKVRAEESYSSGSYLNQAEYITTYYCDICGVQVDREVKLGGFG